MKATSTSPCTSTTTRDPYAVYRVVRYSRTSVRHRETLAVEASGLTFLDASRLAGQLRSEHAAEEVLFGFAVQTASLAEQAACLARGTAPEPAPDREAARPNCPPRRGPDAPPQAVPAGTPRPTPPRRYKNEGQRLHAVLGAAGVPRERHHAVASDVVGRPVASLSDLSPSEVALVRASVAPAGPAPDPYGSAGLAGYGLGVRLATLSL